MNERHQPKSIEALKRVESVYKIEKPGFLIRLRKAGRTIEEAEDLVHDVYAETLARLSLVPAVRNLSAWINSLLTKRMIDFWRHEKTRAARGESEAAEETLREIIAGVGLDPQDACIQAGLLDALNDALRALPTSQRKVVEAQVFGGLTFKEIADATGESIDALTARKRYAVRKLSRALRQWIED